MNQNPLSSLLSDFWSDLRDPGLLWQIAALAACLVTGWALARLVRSRVESREVQMRVMRLGMKSFTRVLSPLLALGFIAIAKTILAQWHYHVNLLRVAIPLVGSFALIRLAFYVLRRIFARGGKAGTSLLAFEKVFATLVWCAVALYITGLWPELVSYLEQTVLPVGRNKVPLMTIVQAAASVLVTLIIALWAGASLEERLMRMNSMHSSLRVVLARMGRAVFILLAVLLSLSLVGIDLTVLSVFGGALGVGLGLGLQKIVSSYVSGFVILLERSLAIGDIVKIGEHSGQVTQINTRYTILRGMDGIETVVPNEMLLSGVVQNYSLTDRRMRLATRVTVGYRTDMDLVLRLLELAASGMPRVLQDPAPQAFLVAFAADGLELELAFWIADPENGRLALLSDVNRLIWKMFQQNQIEVPYPQREVRILEVPESVADARPMQAASAA
ncbi:mechanosensitive ion channel family protein [Noviherbaspirillum autotrophicum]|uniref:Mechanosensitive ion channel protein n=1 Tax=Noviherbaspirillum autotrophicum TaxID=709839 RepID=A0A0C2BKG5_9BURK|nr:mechanosensitive ion channel domain-containing protein [Noviherbaspirillum autotrophicum]KIF80469.1 mechanosensitive ion channel protein [Noviherbaspirillum autotrophicum]